MLTNIRKFFRPLLNELRKVNKIPFLERFLAKKTQGKKLSNFWVKLLPSIYSYKRNNIRKVTRNGINYELDISDYIQYVIYFGLAAEPKKALYDSVKNGMFVFDIGTNMGETLLNFAKINTAGKNFGFEPVPFLFEKANKNLQLNNFQNISLNNIALSNHEETLFFELPPNRNFGSISMSSVKNPQSSEVKAVTFDNFIELNNINKVDFIKIDVEGFESNVLAGAEKTIRRFKPLMFIEVVDSYLKRNNSGASKLVLNVINLGYKIFDAESLKPLDQSMDFEDKWLDILCLPENG